jgi:uncharacterized protein HemY
LLLDPANPGEVHFQLAQLLRRTGDPAARQEVLYALEEAPRNRAALNLLREVVSTAVPAAPTPVPDPITVPAVK